MVTNFQGIWLTGSEELVWRDRSSGVHSLRRPLAQLGCPSNHCFMDGY
jgi:hypothetical protein